MFPFSVYSMYTGCFFPFHGTNILVLLLLPCFFLIHNKYSVLVHCTVAVILHFFFIMGLLNVLYSVLSYSVRVTSRSW